MGQFQTLAEDLKVRVNPVQEALGHQYFEKGYVDISTAREGHLTARVSDGRQRYKAKINWNGEQYAFQCACGTSKLRVCEHVWATILEALEGGWVDDEDEYWMDNDSDWVDEYSPPPSRRRIDWKSALSTLSRPIHSGDGGAPWPRSRQIAYVLDIELTLQGKGLVVETCSREPRATGELGQPRAIALNHQLITSVPDGADRLLLSMLSGAKRESDYYYSPYTSASQHYLNESLARIALPQMCGTGRCLVRPAGGRDAPLLPLRWGEDRPWTVQVEVRPERGGYLIEGVLERDEQRRLLPVPLLLSAGGLVFWKEGEGVVAEPLQDFGAFQWVCYMRQHGSIRVPGSGAAELSRRLYEAGALPSLRLPDELKLEEVRVEPQCHLKLRAPTNRAYDSRLIGTLTFIYDGATVNADAAGRGIVQVNRKRVLLRDEGKEAAAMARLFQLGFRSNYSYDVRGNALQLTPTKLPKVVATLVRERWQVEAEGKLYRSPGDFRIEVTSGIDWFDLNAKVEFGDQTASLPQLLAALRKGEGVVQLGDGTFGMLPEDWLKKYGHLAGMGKEEGDTLRFGRAQAGLLDALLAAQGDGAAKWDEVFENTRRMLREFEGVQAAEPPESFEGALRPYQKDGLGWLGFLRKFGFGGCLADDMGLGKTVQVLAMLLERRQEAQASAAAAGNGKAAKPKAAKAADPTPRPSLVVVPRSLVFNWKAEAQRFAPGLRVLDHSVSSRVREAEHLGDHDIVLTTYGTLRNDAAYLKDVEFDYVILDESQAIKNAASESAKAARLLRGRHRLALSGTPVQNHLGELWSLFEFLNPGMLGSASVFSNLAGAARTVDEQSRAVLARAVRPFVLRRTKEQVAKDLPEKLEQTIHCELDKKQRKLYDELKEYYRRSLLELVAQKGMNRAKIQVLEALLRLRQAACHPGLLDKQRESEPSAKLDTLMPRLSEVVEEGHKALVFSQFTSFLAIVKKRLMKEKIKFEYLDGQTRDRQARVDRFQSDEKCPVFLISLKAGGVGLNLTAADYVFLLDPWWNPAAEAQAIDRAHRIGQTKRVFACRLIARNTVEEKVLELQNSKRALADAIINADNSMIGTLKREDLELLLS